MEPQVAEMRADVVRYLIQVIGVRTRNAHEAWRVLPSTVIIYGELLRERVSLETDVEPPRSSLIGKIIRVPASQVKC